MARPLRIAALIKQIPKFEEMELGPDGRLVREGLRLEMNPYCRRAIGQGTTLAAETGGSLTVFTLGPPPAEDSLREALAWADQEGATADAVLISDPAFAGSDTLATARALAAALEREGPFDLVLAGRNSVDADTGQVGPEAAELLDLPFLGGVRELSLDLDAEPVRVHARLEHDDGWARATVSLPAVLSCAERLCTPAKMDHPDRDAVDGSRVRTLTAADLGDGPWGQAGSPTRVGEVRTMDIPRLRKVLDGPVGEAAAEAVAILADRGAFETGARSLSAGRVPVSDDQGKGTIGVVVEPGRERLTRELLGAAARLAAEIGGGVTALGPSLSERDAAALGPSGADRAVVLDGPNVEEDVAGAVAAWAEDERPWAVLAPSTVWGREVAARAAARLGAGLTGDAVEVELGDHGRLVAWKPAFGGALVAAITATSPVQMVTVRAGVLPVLDPREGEASVGRRSVQPRGRVTVHERTRDDDVDVIAAADMVIGLGQAIPPDRYSELDDLARVLGAELGCTRKVTDQGWMPRARQIGITGLSIQPRLFVSLAASGKFNHTVGIRGAANVLAVNHDPDALIFGACDVGIVGDWAETVPALVEALRAQLS